MTTLYFNPRHLINGRIALGDEKAEAEAIATRAEEKLEELCDQRGWSLQLSNISQNLAVEISEADEAAYRGFHSARDAEDTVLSAAEEIIQEVA